MMSESIGRWRWLLWAAAIVSCVTAAFDVVAHEGHAPLPTRGASVDVKQGRIVLSAEARRALGVQTDEVVLDHLDEHSLAFATLVSPWSKHRIIAARIGGRIDRLNVTAGQRVPAGQALAEISSPELELAQGELLAAANELDLAQKRESQIQSLTGQQVSPERELLEAQVRRLEAENAVRIARSRLATMGVEQEVIEALLQNGDSATRKTIQLRSPFAGTIMHSDLTVGKVIEPFEHLFELIDVGTVWVRIGVLERDLPKVVPGQRATLRLNALPDQEFLTDILIKTDYLDPVTHLGTVWAELVNQSAEDPSFLPGMTGTAVIRISSDEPRLTIPKSALITQGAERYVLVEEASTRKASEYQKRSVVVVRESFEDIQIQAGSVFEGDRVVTTGSHILSNFFIQGVLTLTPEAAENAGLRLQPAQPQRVQDVLLADGEVSLPAGNVATVTAQLAGTLEQIHIDRGQAVRKGDVIAEIDSLELQSLQLKLLQSHLETTLLEDTLQRLEGLDASQLVARRRLWETQNRFEIARNQRDTAKRQLVAVGLTLEQIEATLSSGEALDSLPIRAPIDGSIIAFRAVLGQSVRADEPLFEIHNLSQAAIQVFLSERDAPRIRLGMPARVYLLADPHTSFEATVARTSRSFASDDRTLSVWLELNEAPQQPLRNGAFVRAAISLRQSDPVLAVPLRAVASEGTRSFVFVQGKQGRFERRSVRLGRRDDRLVQIISGIAAGEMVAVEGVSDLQTAHALIR